MADGRTPKHPCTRCGKLLWNPAKHCWDCHVAHRQSAASKQGPLLCTVICEGERCTRPAKFKTPQRCCDAHHRRWLLYGDVCTLSKRAPGTLLHRIERAAVASTDECIIPEGYSIRPQLSFRGTFMKAARAVWIVANGDPGDRWVLHRCNGGSGDHGCINIRHLYLGSPQQNAIDRETAGRGARLAGPAHPNAKLTVEEVREIRRRYTPGRRAPHDGSAAVLAAEFGITVRYLRRVASGQRWTAQR